MSYVDGFVLAVPKDNIEAYRKFSNAAADVWLQYGALTYKEFVADDVPPGKTTSFPLSVKAESNETVVFAYITYKSREHRDEVNTKVMADPRMKDMDPKTAPFDAHRMIFGGFKNIVDR
ncbi:MAG: DUF1428 domain-containing protein [Polyangiales bacterium]